MVLGAAGPMEKILDSLSRCGKRVETVTRKAEVMADNMWHHREYIYSQNFLFWD